jgi:hypothetical protein
LNYNLGCYYCLSAQPDAAIARLQRAFGLDPVLRTLAATDPDLVLLRPRLGQIA